MAKDYIPGREKDLWDWSINLSNYVQINYQRWGINDISLELADKTNAFGRDVETMRNPNHGKIDVLKKNQSKKELIKTCRTYVQGCLIKNPKVTDEDRKKMAIPLRDKVPSPIGAPTSQVTANMSFPGKGLVKIDRIKSLSESSDKRAEYGVRIHFGILDKDAEVSGFIVSKEPKTGNDLPYSVFTRKRSYSFDFTQYSGKLIYFCMRFENSKGEIGPWGNIIAGYIP